MRIAALPLVIGLGSLGSAPARAKDATPTAAEIVARHLDAIGSAEARSAVASRQAEGTCRLDITRGGAGHLAGGRARLTSDGRRFKLELPLPHSDYWGESFSFDGKSTDVGYVQQRRRSVLGEFLNTYDSILEEGLFGVEEAFSDFGTVDGLTLPKRWRVTFDVEGPSSSALWTWEAVVEKVVSSGPAGSPAP